MLIAHKRTAWYWSNYVMPIVPFGIWAFLFNYASSGKSISNFAEGVWLGIVVTLAFIIRVIVGKRGTSRIVSLGLLCFLCVIAVGPWHFVPGIT